ncbi:hypothetical protein B0H17DRAFT_1206653 [Mycena rosella]|uniref:F-box domain-containing protein n=1 Tax=Mycena rosella TaxID=1033263 RepID=A0AAD7D895_MYCRO|nr:hypothetical protein B0H17DRAFT_1206653 [Mycena rosella]
MPGPNSTSAGQASFPRTNNSSASTPATANVPSTQPRLRAKRTTDFARVSQSFACARKSRNAEGLEFIYLIIIHGKEGARKDASDRRPPLLIPEPRNIKHDPMPTHISKKFWKRSCGLPRWFLYENIPPSDTSEALPSSNAPIGKLPVELLGEIFSWNLGDWGEMTDEPSTLVLDPLILSQVCGHWRSVSLSIPMLWATIWVDRPRVAHVAMVKLWIERSRNCPLSINLRQTDPKSCLSFPTTTEHDLTDQIFGLLVPHLHRWHTVDFVFRGDAQHSLLSLPRDEAAALEYVALHVDSWDTTSSESLQCALYSRPSLRSIHFMPGSNQRHVPWKQLTHLEADPECTLDTCLSILASCPALSSAKFTCSADPDWAHTPFTHPEQYLTLPALVDLSMKASRIDLTPFLNRLTLSALKSLALEYCHVPRAMPDPQALHTLLERSSCNLSGFSLHETARVRDDKRHISYLHSPHMASLADLALKIDMTNNIIEFLTYGGAEGAPQLPNLTEITLRDCRGDHISDDALVRMLSSRLAPLESFTPAILRCADIQLRMAGHADLVLPVGGHKDQLELRFELLNCFCK